jgi:hypothetical protein
MPSWIICGYYIGIYVGLLRKTTEWTRLDIIPSDIRTGYIWDAILERYH